MNVFVTGGAGYIGSICTEELLNAGHIAGSNMFLVRGEKAVLYTGDMSTRDRFGMEGARPIKTDVLIIESTYGDPSYRFDSDSDPGFAGFPLLFLSFG